MLVVTFGTGLEHQITICNVINPGEFQMFGKLLKCLDRHQKEAYGNPDSSKPKLAISVYTLLAHKHYTTN